MLTRCVEIFEETGQIEDKKDMADLKKNVRIDEQCHVLQK